jgi:hypothetical protein
MARKRHHDPEYILRVFHHQDERTQQKNIAFVLETTKEFTNFNYQILLDATTFSNTIVLRILGLQTTALTMPGVGAARGRAEFANLHGFYVLNIVKLDGEANQFRLHFTPAKISVVEAPPQPFVVLSPEPVHFQAS